MTVQYSDTFTGTTADLASHTPTTAGTGYTKASGSDALRIDGSGALEVNNDFALTAYYMSDAIAWNGRLRLTVTKASASGEIPAIIVRCSESAGTLDGYGLTWAEDGDWDFYSYDDIANDSFISTTIGGVADKADNASGTRYVQVDFTGGDTFQATVWSDGFEGSTVTASFTAVDDSVGNRNISAGSVYFGFYSNNADDLVGSILDVEFDDLAGGGGGANPNAMHSLSMAHHFGMMNR